MLFIYSIFPFCDWRSFPATPRVKVYDRKRTRYFKSGVCIRQELACLLTCLTKTSCSPPDCLQNCIHQSELLLSSFSKCRCWFGRQFTSMAPLNGSMCPCSHCFGSMDNSLNQQRLHNTVTVKCCVKDGSIQVIPGKMNCSDRF